MKQRNASPIKIFLCRIICHFNWPCNINSFDIIVTKGLYPLMYCKINHAKRTVHPTYGVKVFWKKKKPMNNLYI